MLLGAVFEREIAFARARGLYVARAIYAAALLTIVATCWLVVSGTQAVATAGDTARFGATLMRILAPLQLTLAMLAAALTGAVAVSTEKDRRTLGSSSSVASPIVSWCWGSWPRVWSGSCSCSSPRCRCSPSPPSSAASPRHS